MSSYFTMSSNVLGSRSNTGGKLSMRSPRAARGHVPPLSRARLLELRRLHAAANAHRAPHPAQRSPAPPPDLGQDLVTKEATAGLSALGLGALNPLVSAAVTTYVPRGAASIATAILPTVLGPIAPILPAIGGAIQGLASGVAGIVGGIGGAIGGLFGGSTPAPIFTPAEQATFLAREQVAIKTAIANGVDVSPPPPRGTKEL